MGKVLGIKELCEFWQALKGELNNKANAADVYTKTQSDDRYVNVSGDTMTGNLSYKNTNITVGTAPSSTLYGNSRVRYLDNNGTLYGYSGIYYYTNGTVWLENKVTRTISGTAYYNGVDFGIKSDGTRTVSVSAPAAWRTALSVYSTSDVYTKTEADNRYVNVTGDTMTGALTITGASRRLYVNNTSAATEAYMEVANSKGRAILDAYSDGKRGLWVSDIGWLIYGVGGQSYAYADKVYRVTSVHRAVSYIVGAKGDAALYCPKTYNVDAWYPAVCLETKGGGSWQIGNYNSENLQFAYATKANRDSSTNTVAIATLPVITANKTICFTDHTHAAGDITSGTFGIDRIPTITVAKGGTGRTVGFTWTQIMGGTVVNNGSTKAVGSITGYKEIMIICRPSTRYVASIVLPVDFFDSTAYEIYLSGGSTALNASSYNGRAAACSLTSGGTFKAITCVLDGVTTNATWFIRGR